MIGDRLRIRNLFNFRDVPDKISRGFFLDLVFASVFATVVETGILDFLETPFAQSFETVHDIAGYAIMRVLPGFTDQAVGGPLFFAIEVKTHYQEELGVFFFPLRSDR